MPTLYPIIRRKRRPLLQPETVSVGALVPPVVVDHVEPVSPPSPTESPKPTEVAPESRKRKGGKTP